MKAKQKQHIRAKKKKIRERLDPEEVKIRSSQIVYALLEEFDLLRKKVMIYLPQKQSNEVDTWQLLDELLNSDSEVYFPVYEKDSNTINPVKVTKETLFKDDKLGIPSIEQGSINIEEGIEFDFIIIPLIAFDLKGNRVGHGNGAYDKFLSLEKASGATKIGLAYHFQLDKKGIPAEKNDRKINYCVTEERIYKFL